MDTFAKQFLMLILIGVAVRAVADIEDAVVAAATVDGQGQGVGGGAAVGIGRAGCVFTRGVVQTVVDCPSVLVASGDNVVDGAGVDVDGQVQRIDARATGSVGVGVHIVASGGIGSAVPHIAVALGHRLSVVGSVVDGENQLVGAGAAGIAGVVVAIGAAGVVHCAVPFDAVASRLSDNLVGGQVDGQVQGIYTRATVVGSIIICISTAGGVGQAIATLGSCPYIAVASSLGESLVAVVVDGQVQRVGAGAAFSGVVAVGVVASGGVGLVVASPGVGVASCIGVGSVAVVVDREGQRLGGGALVFIGVVVDIGTAGGVGQAVAVGPGVSVASRGGSRSGVDSTLVDLQHVDKLVERAGVLDLAEPVGMTRSADGVVGAVPLIGGFVGAGVDLGGVIVVDNVDGIGAEIVAVSNRTDAQSSDDRCSNAVKVEGDGNIVRIAIDGVGTQAGGNVDGLGAVDGLKQAEVQHADSRHSASGIKCGVGRVGVYILVGGDILEHSIAVAYAFAHRYPLIGVAGAVGSFPSVAAASLDVDLNNLVVSDDRDDEVQMVDAVAAINALEGMVDNTVERSSVHHTKISVGTFVDDEFAIGLVGRVDGQVQDAVARAAVGIGEGDGIVAARGVGGTVHIPGVGGASRLGQLNAGVGVDGQSQGDDTVATGLVGGGPLVVAALGVGLTVAVGPGVAVASRNGNRLCSAGVDSQSEGNSAVATINAGVFIGIDTRLSVGGSIPNVAVANHSVEVVVVGRIDSVVEDGVVALRVVVAPDVGTVDGLDHKRVEQGVVVRVE